MKSRQGIGYGTQFQPLEIVILDEDGNTKKTRRRQNVRESSFQRNLTTQETGELAATREHLLPYLHTLGFVKIEMRDRAEISLKELTARGQVEAFERVR